MNSRGFGKDPGRGLPGRPERIRFDVGVKGLLVTWSNLVVMWMDRL